MLALLNRQSILAASRAATRSRSNVLPTVALVNHRAFLVPTAVRYAANPQSGKPASDNWSHTAKNIKEEASGVVNQVGKAVAGMEGSTKTEDGETKQTSEIFSDAVSVITGELSLPVKVKGCYILTFFLLSRYRKASSVKSPKRYLNQL